VKIKTSRFGELQVEKTDIINFQEGILGFEHLKKFFIVDPGDSTLILWLQSIEDEKVAFPMIEPKIFMPNYSISLLPMELQSLDMEGVTDAKVYSILTIPKEVTQMSANLKAPVIINPMKRIGRQIVLQDSKLSVKCEMYRDLKQYIVNFSSDDSKRTTVNEPGSAMGGSEAESAPSTGEPATKPQGPTVEVN